MQTMGWDVDIVENLSLEEGIKAARLIFPRIYADKNEAGHLVNRLARYKRTVNEQSGVIGAPVHDDQSHGADAFRYLSLVADQLRNDDVNMTDVYAGLRRGWAA